MEWIPMMGELPVLFVLALAGLGAFEVFKWILALVMYAGCESFRRDVHARVEAKRKGGQ